MRSRLILSFFLVMSCAVAAAAQGIKIDIGSTRAEVVNAYGEPRGAIRSGSQEILSYEQGMITLEEGKVISIDPARGVRVQSPPSAAPARSIPARDPGEKPQAQARKGQASQPTRKANVQRVKTFKNKGQQIDMETVLEPGYVTIVDFYADWCPPCRKISPELERIANTDPDVVLRKIDIVDWKTPVVKQYNIRSVPNIRVFDGRGTMVGNPTASLTEVKGNIKEAK